MIFQRVEQSESAVNFINTCDLFYKSFSSISISRLMYTMVQFRVYQCILNKLLRLFWHKRSAFVHQANTQLVLAVLTIALHGVSMMTVFDLAACHAAKSES